MSGGRGRGMGGGMGGGTGRGGTRSPFAPDVLADGRRRYSHRAVVARRTLLVGIVAAGTSTGVIATQAGGSDDAAGTSGAGAGDPAVHDAAAQASPSATPSAPPAHSLTEAGSPWVIVNKQHPIAPHDYAPEITVVGGKEVASTIAADLKALLAAAKDARVSLGVTSGFRSLAHQEDVHDNAVARDGMESAESVSARPGYSEHQTGLAVDFSGSSRPGCLLENCFGQTPESDWLVANAGRFGFVLRYPDGKTEITGYAPEPWHWRWVGTDLVAQMAAKRVVTMEEFFGVSGGTTYA